MRDPKSDSPPDSPDHGSSRRSFLKGAGLGAAVATLADYVAEAAEAALAVRGPGSVALTLTVNGAARLIPRRARPRAPDASGRRSFS